MNGIIEHLCANPDHRPAVDAEYPFALHDGKRGYCPAGAVDGHDWRATGGKTLATVRDWLDRPTPSGLVRVSEVITVPH